MAASLAHGETGNCECSARTGNRIRLGSPHQNGAKIEGVGSSTFAGAGRGKIRTARITMFCLDRIETGTYAMAVAMTGGNVLLEGARPAIFGIGITDPGKPARSRWREWRYPYRAEWRRASGRLISITEPFPGFRRIW